MEIYRVLSDSTAAELDSKQDVSDEGGPVMPPFYARRDNREGEIEWEDVSSDELTGS